MLISLLFLIFGIELSYYFAYGIGNFLWEIPIDFVKQNESYFSYGILILIFGGGFISGIVAVRHNIIRKVAIIVMILNLIGVLIVTFILGLGIYNNYKDDQEVITEEQEKNVVQATGNDVENGTQISASVSESEEEKKEMTEAAETQEVQTDTASQEETVAQQNLGIHTYDFICRSNVGTWEDAYKECIQNNAHLVTFETQEEFQYVTEQLTNKGYQNYIFYIGGRRDMDSQQYYWIDKNNNLTGDALNNVESWTSECWLTGEPSFRDEGLNLDEHVMCMFYKEDIGRWVWNDIPNDLVSAIPAYDGKIGIIYEYEN